MGIDRRGRDGCASRSESRRQDAEGSARRSGRPQERTHIQDWTAGHCNRRWLRPTRFGPAEGTQPSRLRELSLDLLVRDGVRVTCKIGIDPSLGFACPSRFDLPFAFRSKALIEPIDELCPFKGRQREGIGDYGLRPLRHRDQGYMKTDHRATATGIATAARRSRIPTSGHGHVQSGKPASPRRATVSSSRSRPCPNGEARTLRVDRRPAAIRNEA